jgi:hypothetical protein
MIAAPRNLLMNPVLVGLKSRAMTAMRQVLLALLNAAILAHPAQVIGNDQQLDIDLLNKIIRSSNGTEPYTKMDAESARRILAHFSSPKDRWEHFLGKIRTGEKGAIVTALHVIEFASRETQQEMRFALQETLIEAPEVVLDANAKAGVSLQWVCGRPAKESYDLAVHLIDGRISVLEQMLAAMDSSDEWMRQIYDRDLRPMAQECLVMVRKTATKR